MSVLVAQFIFKAHANVSSVRATRNENTGNSDSGRFQEIQGGSCSRGWNWAIVRGPEGTPLITARLRGGGAAYACATSNRLLCGTGGAELGLR